MNIKAVVPLVAGLCVGGLALKMGFSSLQKAQGAQPNVVTLWALREDIPRGNAIAEFQLEARPFPANLVPPGAVTDKSQISGRVLRTLAPTGVPVLESMLLPKDAKPGIWVKPGYRAVAVRVDESSGVDNHLEPGCRVDVVGYFSTRRAGRSDIIARTLIENVEVAAVGQRITAAGEIAEKPDAKKPSSMAVDKKVRAVTLLVKPEDVPALHLAEQRGKIKLSMRGEGESAVNSAIRSIAEDEVLGFAPEEKMGNTPGGLMGRIGSLFGGKKSPPESKPIAAVVPPRPEPKPPTPQPQPPAHAWTMRIFNGSQQVTLGWSSLTSIEPQQVAAAREGRAARNSNTAVPAGPIHNQPVAAGTNAHVDASADAEDDMDETETDETINSEPEERYE